MNIVVQVIIFLLIFNKKINRFSSFTCKGLRMNLSNSGADSQGCQFQDFATDLVLFHSFLLFFPTSPPFRLYYLVEESIQN